MGKILVERCPMPNIAGLRRQGVFDRPGVSAIYVNTASGEMDEQPIGVSTTRPNFGGSRPPRGRLAHDRMRQLALSSAIPN